MKSKIFIVSTVKDVSNTLESEFWTLQNAFSSFDSVNWVIAESDSSDKTNRILENLATRSNNLRHISLGNLENLGMVRTERIATSRNRALEVLFSDFSVKSDDFIVLADLDNRNRLLSQKTVMSCWNMDHKWDMCAANQRGFYYDIWALRHPQWCPSDCFIEFRQLLDAGFDRKSAYKLAVRNRMIHIDSNASPIKVQSAFGGLAIYRSEMLKNVMYRGLDNDNNEECDHVYVNQILSDSGYKLYINPKLINSRSETYPNRIYRSLRRRAFEVIHH